MASKLNWPTCLLIDVAADPANQNYQVDFGRLPQKIARRVMGIGGIGLVHQ